MHTRQNFHCGSTNRACMYSIRIFSRTHSMKLAMSSQQNWKKKHPIERKASMGRFDHTHGLKSCKLCFNYCVHALCRYLTTYSGMLICFFSSLLLGYINTGPQKWKRACTPHPWYSTWQATASRLFLAHKSLLHTILRAFTYITHTYTRWSCSIPHIHTHTHTHNYVCVSVHTRVILVHVQRCKLGYTRSLSLLCVSVRTRVKSLYVRACDVLYVRVWCRTIYWCTLLQIWIHTHTHFCLRVHLYVCV